MNEHHIIDSNMKTRAAIKGTADDLDQTSLGQAAILSTLLNEGHQLNDFERHGLLVALQGLNDRVNRRANHLYSHLAEMGDA